MIRYEYEEDEMFSDHRMPLARSADLHPTIEHHQQVSHFHSEFLSEGTDWLDTDAPVNIDEYAQNFNADVFNELDIEGEYDDLQPVNQVEQHRFNDSLFDSHHTSYYTNSTVDEVHHETNMNIFHDYYIPQPSHHRQETQPLRSRDLNISSHHSSGRQEKKKSQSKKATKTPSQRRPIDEYPTKNGFKKPAFSYSCLIGLALRNSSTGELTVADIYRFLCEHFPFFREAPSGWKNSVRHNLSLNKCFQKVETMIAADPQGRRSCLWKINPAKLERMDSEIKKWRERSAPTIALAMDTPSNLDDIISGRKGMPPTDELYVGMNGRDDEDDFVPGQRSKERVIYFSRMQGPGKFDNQRPRQIESRQHHFHSVPGHSKYIVRQPLRCIKQDDNIYHDDNFESSMPSTSSNVPSSSFHKFHACSIHEKAMRKFESLLEKKKHATVHPRNDAPIAAESIQENQENFAPQKEALMCQSHEDSIRSARAIRIQRLQALNTSESSSFSRSPPASIRPTSSAQ